MYICVYIYIYTYIYIYICMYLSLSIYIYIHTHMRVPPGETNEILDNSNNNRQQARTITQLDNNSSRQ